MMDTTAMGQMMREMERMMGGPVRKPLMSRLLDVQKLSEADRIALRTDAAQQIHQGLEALERGTRALAAARRASDEVAIARAIDEMKDGAARWEAGTAVQQALSLPRSSAGATATRWFRSELNLEVPAAVRAWPWGLSPVHLAVMTILGLTAAGGLLLYLYKIRRSLALLARLTRDPQP